MVKTPDNQQSLIDHSKNVNGFNGQSNDSETIELPLKTIEKKQMVSSEALINKASNHMTNETIELEGGKKKKYLKTLEVVE